MRPAPLFLLLTLLLALHAAAQQPDTLRHSIPAPPVGTQVDAELGFSVAIEGSYAIAGAPYDDSGASDSGAVKVFNSVTGALLLIIRKPIPAYGAHFGASIGISGTRVVVGAPGDYGTADAGSAYVFDLASGTPTVPVATFHASNPAASDYFGEAVAISGTKVVVGAPGGDTAADDAGSAYVYDLSSITPVVPAAVLNNPAPATGDRFGEAVAIDGSRIVIGSGWNGGGAYVYDLTSATPTTPVTTLSRPTGPGGYYGSAVAISGTRLIVGAYYDDTGDQGAGSAYVYDLASPTPTAPIVTLNNPHPHSGDYFGAAVGISGTRVVVGGYFGAFTPDDDNAYVYDVTSATPTTPAAVLNNPGADNRFGWSAAISGTQLLLGASTENGSGRKTGRAFVYNLGGPVPTTPVAVLNHPGPAPGDACGSAVAISGTRLVVGAISDNTVFTEAGGAHVYDLANSTPAVPVVTLLNPTPDFADRFGEAVAISGTRVVIGASGDDTGTYGAGSAYVYDLAGATPTTPVATLPNPAPATDAQFGVSVAVSGKWVVVGARYGRTGSAYTGMAYVYDLTSPTPAVPAITLSQPSPAGGDEFGRSVAIVGTKVIVGAPGKDAAGFETGSVYVYDLTGATPATPIMTLNRPGTATYTSFGRSVTFDGMRVAVGAYWGSDAMEDSWSSGRTYVFDLTAATPAVPVATLINLAFPSDYQFGSAIAISGVRVVVGGHGPDPFYPEVPGPGQAYVYDLTAATPTIPVSTLNVVSDQFGESVAIAGTTVCVGAPGDDSTMLDKGAAYVFAPANPDYDGDGLLDLWEEEHFGSITAHTASDDADGDGRKELLEQAFNTDPLAADPVAALPSVVSEGGFLTLTLSKRAGVNYTVETAGSPDDAAFSMGTTTMIANTATTLKVRDNFTPATAAQRFMRVKVTPTP